MWDRGRETWRRGRMENWKEDWIKEGDMGEEDRGKDRGKEKVRERYR